MVGEDKQPPTEPPTRVRVCVLRRYECILIKEASGYQQGILSASEMNVSLCCQMFGHSVTSHLRFYLLS